MPYDKSMYKLLKIKEIINIENIAARNSNLPTNSL